MNDELSGSSSWKKRLFRYVLILSIWCGSCVILGALYLLHDIPNLDASISPTRTRQVTILASTGEILANIGDLYGEFVPFDQTPSRLIHAVLATEDQRFFYHFGIDPIGLVRAAYVNYRAGKVVQGGSTITQQLAKNLFLSPERTLKRKLQEALLAFYLEYHYSKEEILAQYLNRVYMGAGIYGVSGAARYYFGTNLSDISIYQAALIAGLLKAPSRYSPANNEERADARTQQILRNMYEANYITEEEWNRERVKQLDLEESALGSLKNPYFADWVMEQIPYFTSDTQSDLIVETTLNPALQQRAEHAVSTIMQRNKKQSKAQQAAFIAMTHEGEVLAMVGGLNYAKSPFNRATRALRQPGSSFKPIVYLAALEKEIITPNSQIEDGPLSIGRWSPRNYDGHYYGNVSIYEAVARSLNTVAVRVSEQTGRPNVINMAKRLGITSPIPSVPSIALGSSEVTLLELTGSYATIANEGVAVWPYGISRIKTSDNTVLYQHRDDSRDIVVSKKATQQLRQLLEGAVQYGTGKAASFNWPSAGKTGTTSDFRDALFVGFTSEFVAGTWVGNDDNSPMRKVTGGTIPAQIWRQFMIDAHAGMPVRGFDDHLDTNDDPGNGSPGSQNSLNPPQSWQDPDAPSPSELSTEEEANSQATPKTKAPRPHDENELFWNKFFQNN
jgi:penicillin-binding protein 1A